MEKIKQIRLNKHPGKGDYSILPVEIDNSIVPFELKKTYFILGGESESKSGQHAHFKEKEVFIVLRGLVKFITIDENSNDLILELGVCDGVYVPAMVWHGFEALSPNCVVIAYSSEHYNPDRKDYLEDKTEFLKTIN